MAFSKGAESWVILSQIERQIKEKIERVGIPLKDWDIQINYGIKTGFNEAFIINGAKRQELINQDPKSAEIIRPILRGRDIKRYSYEHSDKYIIATFPSLNIDIEQYPSVKSFLEGFKPKLKQTGELLTNLEIENVLKHAKQHGISISEKDLKASRKKTNNKWFETQDSISYWEDFNKHKIVYPETTQGAYFAFDDKGFMIDKTCFMIVSKYDIYLQKTLSSKLFAYAYKNIFSSVELGEKGYQYNKHALIKLPVLHNSKAIQVIEDTICQKDVDSKIFEFYNISKEEIDFIEQLDK